MTEQEYATYQQRVAQFFAHGLTELHVDSTTDGRVVEPSIASSPCLCCGTTKTGGRYQCHGYNEQTDKTEHFNGVCGDCLYYAAYDCLEQFDPSNK